MVRRRVGRTPASSEGGAGPAGGLGAAALDVFWSEPDPDSRLTALPNVTLSPHQGSGTVQTRDAMASLIVDNLEAHFAGQPLISPVDLTRP